MPTLTPGEVQLPYGREEVQAERARRSLHAYVEEAWPIVEPGREFVDGKHIHRICEHLEAITRGEIRNLVINIPPRHAKSLLVSVFWPTWEWIDNPELGYLMASYGDRLAIRDALRSRRLLQSDWYQRHYGDRFILTGDQNQKSYYENDRGGHRLAAGVGGMVTGQGGDRLVLDDPHKVGEAQSETARESAIDFWTETMSTRGNDPETVAKVIVMQRVHERDVTGDVIEQMENGGEQYEMLILPAEYEPGQHFYPNQLRPEKDWRTEEGELLWPERFTRPTVENLKVTLNEEAAGQLQQRPTAAGGAFFKEEWWGVDESGSFRNRYDPTDHRLLNTTVARWSVWDTASKTKESNAFTAGVIGELLPDYRLLIRYVHEERLGFDALPDTIIRETGQFTRDEKLRETVIEDAASGTQAIQVLQASGPAWLNVTGFDPMGKEVSWKAASAWCGRGCVLLPEPSESVPWLHNFERQIFTVPNSRYLDMADAFAMLINYVEQMYGALSRGYVAREAAA